MIHLVGADVPAIEFADDGHVARHGGVEAEINAVLLVHDFDFLCAFALLLRWDELFLFDLNVAEMGAEVLESIDGLTHQIVK